MPNFYDLTTPLHAPDPQDFGAIKLYFSNSWRQVCDTTVALRLGSLTPSAAYELWATCTFEHVPDAENGFREMLAQYYLENTGYDIADWPPHHYREEVRAVMASLATGDVKPARV